MNLEEAQHLARRLMNEHGLAQWKFAFDRATRRFGSCNWSAKRITLSWKLTMLNGEPQVRETILHEIAHALAPHDGHGRKWQLACAKLGIKPIRCYTEAEVRSPARTSRYEIGCASCDWWSPRFRRPTRMLVCRSCRSGAMLRERSTGRAFQIKAVGARIRLEPVAHPKPCD